MIYYDDSNTIWYNVKDFDKHEPGTIIESDDETVLIGTKELHFVAFQDRIFLKRSLSDIIIRPIA